MPPSGIHQLKITLRDIRLPVWRRIAVPSSITLSELGGLLEVAFDWKGGHQQGFGLTDEYAVILQRVAGRAGTVLGYTYDLGDVWHLQIEVEDVSAADPEQVYPVCFGGQGLAPPDKTNVEFQSGRFDRGAVTKALRHEYGAIAGEDLVEEGEATGHEPFTGLF